MSSERKRRAEIVRLIVTTRERFPHTPRLTAALKRIMWQYVAPLPGPLHRKRRASRKDRQ